MLYSTSSIFVCEIFGPLLPTWGFTPYNVLCVVLILEVQTSTISWVGCTIAANLYDVQKPDAKWNVADVSVQPWHWCGTVFDISDWWLEDCEACQSASLGSRQNSASSFW